MRAISFLLGCTLGFGVIATAAATTNTGACAANESGCAQQSTASDSGSAHDAISTADGTALAHDPIPAQSTTPPATGKASGSDIHVDGGDNASPPTTHRVSLGWQSLLPGSIQ